MATSDVPRRRLLDRVSTTPTLLGAGSRFEGRLHVDGPLVLEGTVVGDGEVRGVLSVSGSAEWHGDVHAASAVISGRVTGNLTVDEKLEIGRAAVIRGNVRARQLAIAHGAVVDGELQVTGDQPVMRFEERRASRLTGGG